MIYDNLTNISYPIYNHTYFSLYIEYQILDDKYRVIYLEAPTCIPDHQMEIPGSLCCPRGGPLGYIFCISDSPAKLIAQHCISANKAWTNSGECVFAIRQLARQCFSGNTSQNESRPHEARPKILVYIYVS